MRLARFGGYAPGTRTADVFTFWALAALYSGARACLKSPKTRTAGASLVQVNAAYAFCTWFTYDRWEIVP